jgi:hypothetical protein
MDQITRYELISLTWFVAFFIYIQTEKIRCKNNMCKWKVNPNDDKGFETSCGRYANVWQAANANYCLYCGRHIHKPESTIKL